MPRKRNAMGAPAAALDGSTLAESGSGSLLGGRLMGFKALRELATEAQGQRRERRDDGGRGTIEKKEDGSWEAKERRRLAAENAVEVQNARRVQEQFAAQMERTRVRDLTEAVHASHEQLRGLARGDKSSGLKKSKGEHQRSASSLAPAPAAYPPSPSSPFGAPSAAGALASAPTAPGGGAAGAPSASAAHMSSKPTRPASGRSVRIAGAGGGDSSVGSPPRTPSTPSGGARTGMVERSAVDLDEIASRAADAAARSAQDADAARDEAAILRMSMIPHAYTPASSMPMPHDDGDGAGAPLGNVGNAMATLLADLSTSMHRATTSAHSLFGSTPTNPKSTSSLAATTGHMCHILNPSSSSSSSSASLPMRPMSAHAAGRTSAGGTSAGGVAMVTGGMRPHDGGHKVNQPPLYTIRPSRSAAQFATPHSPFATAKVARAPTSTGPLARPKSAAAAKAPYAPPTCLSSQGRGTRNGRTSMTRRETRWEADARRVHERAAGSCSGGGTSGGGAPSDAVLTVLPASTSASTSAHASASTSAALPRVGSAPPSRRRAVGLSPGYAGQLTEIVRWPHGTSGATQVRLDPGGTFSHKVRNADVPSTMRQQPPSPSTIYVVE